jgi:hypothetical protein
MNLKRDEENLNRDMEALKTEEKADTMDILLEGILEMLKENEKDYLKERTAWLDPGAPPGQVQPPPICPQI